jgi:hypothetical protein
MADRGNKKRDDQIEELPRSSTDEQIRGVGDESDEDFDAEDLDDEEDEDEEGTV